MTSTKTKTVKSKMKCVCGLQMNIFHIWQAILQKTLSTTRIQASLARARTTHTRICARARTHTHGFQILYWRNPNTSNLLHCTWVNVHPCSWAHANIVDLSTLSQKELNLVSQFHVSYNSLRFECLCSKQFTTPRLLFRDTTLGTH